MNNSHSPYKKINPHTINSGCKLNSLEEPSQAKPPSELFNHTPSTPIMHKLNIWILNKLMKNVLVFKIYTLYSLLKKILIKFYRTSSI